MDIYHRVVWEDATEITKEKLLWEKLKDKTVLITGASGFIGSHLTYSMLAINDVHKVNAKVVALVHNQNRAMDKFCDVLTRKDLAIIEHDVCKPFEYNGGIDYIIHAASPAGSSNVEKVPVDTWQTNTLGTYNMLELARQKNTVHFCYLSSTAVYEDNLLSSGDDLEAFNAFKLYSNAKQGGEATVASFANQYGMTSSILRACSVYGHGVMAGTTQCFRDPILEHKDVVITSDGKNNMQRLYISDAISAIFYIMLKSEKSGVFDLPGDRINLEDWVKLLIEVSQSKSHLKILGLSSKRDYPVADDVPLKALGWKRKIALRKGIARYLQIT